MRIRHTFVLEDESPDPAPLAELIPPQSPTHEVPPDESVRQRIPYEEATGEEDAEVGGRGCTHFICFDHIIFTSCIILYCISALL